MNDNGKAKTLEAAAAEIAELKQDIFSKLDADGVLGDTEFETLGDKYLGQLEQRYYCLKAFEEVIGRRFSSRDTLQYKQPNTSTKRLRSIIPIPNSTPPNEVEIYYNLKLGWGVSQNGNNNIVCCTIYQIAAVIRLREFVHYFCASPTDPERAERVQFFTEPEEAPTGMVQ